MGSVRANAIKSTFLTPFFLHQRLGRAKELIDKVNHALEETVAG